MFLSFQVKGLIFFSKNHDHNGIRVYGAIFSEISNQVHTTHTSGHIFHCFLNKLEILLLYNSLLKRLKILIPSLYRSLSAP